MPEPMRWNQLRATIWERDKGICQVCGEKISWEHYHLGHLVDRMVGGSDNPDNLKVMCSFCNMLKPIHESRDEYDAWVEGGAVLGDFKRRAVENGVWNDLLHLARECLDA